MIKNIRAFSNWNTGHALVTIDRQNVVKQEFMKIELTNQVSQQVEKQYPDRWTEIPPNGKICPFTGLKHGKLYSMLGKSGIARSHVRVANLRDPRARQGKTIFHVGDMFRFLDFLAAQQGSVNNQ